MNIVMTHGNRDLDTRHTSGAEIAAFNQLVLSLTPSSTMSFALDKRVINPIFLQDVHKLIVFVSGHLDEALSDMIEDYHGEVYIVVQDPNWQVVVDLDKEYTLVTPFKTLKDKSNEEISDLLAQHLGSSTFTQFEKHIFVPFGYMMRLSPYYRAVYQDARLFFRDNLADKTKNMDPHNGVYCGSLKIDRFHEMSQMAEMGCDFYGNFTREDFISMGESLGLQTNINASTQFLGRVSPYEVPEILRCYPFVYFAHDPKMHELQTHYIRYLEMTNMRIVMVSRYDDVSDYATPQTVTYQSNIQSGEALNEMKQSLIELGILK